MNNAATVFLRLWLWPCLIGGVTAFGLICALVADGLWDLLGALAIALPTAASLWVVAKACRGGGTGDAAAERDQAGR
ncbi:MAG: hypothetical protein MI920_31795 [Kiloniellales bacterium]|nr:hypothetical protein [Kiloniellales bacterium]